jgi:hypothetical protein
VPGPIHLPGSVTRSSGVIHFSDRFPVVRTTCGGDGPAAARWSFVSCEDCLRAGPDDPRIKQRLADVVARRLEREG